MLTALETNQRDICPSRHRDLKERCDKDGTKTL